MSIFRPRLRTIIASISLLFLILPLGGIYILRIYESALIRQTESELISQAAFVAALYKTEIQAALTNQKLPLSTYGIAAPPRHKANQTITPIPARLDLAKNPIYPARPKPKSTGAHLDALSQVVGQKLIPVLKDTQKITLAGIKVLDYQGLVVAGQDERGLSFSHTQEFQKALQGTPVSLLRFRRMPKVLAPLSSFSRNTSINVFVALPVILENRLIGVVWVNRTPTDLMQSLYGKRSEILWMMAGLLIFSLAVATFASYTITKPIGLLVSKSRQIIEGSAVEALPVDRPFISEIDELSRSFTQMASTLQQRSQYIQNFAAHVSHEFKTPLTAIQGSIELLQDNLDSMSKEKQAHFLANLRQDCERLKLLVNRLLELAKADMTEAFSGATPLAPLISNLSSQFPNLAISVDIPPGLAVRISEEALNAVFSQLFENSLQAGASEVRLSMAPLGETVSLMLQDNGPGISLGNQPEIFTPFFTTKRTSGGTGLGLSIARSLLERQGGSIQLVESASGAVFQLLLPNA